MLQLLPLKRIKKAIARPFKGLRQNNCLRTSNELGAGVRPVGFSGNLHRIVGPPAGALDGPLPVL